MYSISDDIQINSSHIRTPTCHCPSDDNNTHMRDENSIKQTYFTQTMQFRSFSDTTLQPFHARFASPALSVSVYLYWTMLIMYSTTIYYTILGVGGRSALMSAFFIPVTRAPNYDTCAGRRGFGADRPFSAAFRHTIQFMWRNVIIAFARAHAFRIFAYASLCGVRNAIL